jgi:hypothetical protein
MTFFNFHWIKEGKLPSWKIEEIHCASSSLGVEWLLKGKILEKIGKFVKNSRFFFGCLLMRFSNISTISVGYQ